MHCVMILAAGFGSRLRPLTDELPKALLPVGDGPMLQRLCGRLRRAGFTGAVINTHHRAEAFRSVFRSLHFNVEESFEPRILGTAGGIAAARERLSCPLLVHNADIDCDLDFSGLLQRVSTGGICLAVVPAAVGQGSVGLGEQGRVVRLRGEVFGTELYGGDYLGVAALGADCLAELPAEGCLIGDYCLPRLRAGAAVSTMVYDTTWNDIGTLSAYFEVNLSWLLQHQERAGQSHVGPGAHVGAGVQLVDCIVGSDAEVEGNGRLERCVVWPGARARAGLRNAVVTPHQVLQVDLPGGG